MEIPWGFWGQSPILVVAGVLERSPARRLEAVEAPARNPARRLEAVEALERNLVRRLAPWDPAHFRATTEEEAPAGHPDRKV